MSGGDPQWRPVVFADQCVPCDCCDDLLCHVCNDHYSECHCPGPTQDGIEYKTEGGVLYGRPEC